MDIQGIKLALAKCAVSGNMTICGEIPFGEQIIPIPDRTTARVIDGEIVIDDEPLTINVKGMFSPDALRWLADQIERVDPRLMLPESRLPRGYGWIVTYEDGSTVARFEGEIERMWREVDVNKVVWLALIPLDETRPTYNYHVRNGTFSRNGEILLTAKNKELPIFCARKNELTGEGDSVVHHKVTHIIGVAKHEEVEIDGQRVTQITGDMIAVDEEGNWRPWDNVKG